MRDIKIDNTYTMNVNYERYEETANPWDDFASCEEFVRVINGIQEANTSQVTYVQENDEFGMLGLRNKEIR